MSTADPLTARSEWPVDLPLAEVVPVGWKPSPVRQFILKIHSRCNLTCDYCYVYTKSDQSWRQQPTRMSREVLASAAERIAEHVAAYQLPSAEVIFHGGEPLLAGVEFLEHAVTTVRRAVPAETELTFTVQTNGVLLDRRMLDVLARHRVRVGVSVDGIHGDHDRRRRYADGRGSFADVRRAIELLASDAYRPIFAGVLCVVDPEHDPLRTYEALRALEAPAVDFLLPHGNWSSPPPGRSANNAGTPYADWLGTVFDHWFSAPVQEIDIRLFQEIIHLLLGGASRSELVGLSPAGMLVVETDGAWEQVDVLKVNGPGAAATGYHVATDPVDTVLRHPGVAARQIGTAALSTKCLSCPVVRVCGGGSYPHRYRTGAGYRNPSVYCPDLLALIARIEAAVAGSLGLR